LFVVVVCQGHNKKKLLLQQLMLRILCYLSLASQLFPLTVDVMLHMLHCMYMI